MSRTGAWAFLALLWAGLGSQAPAQDQDWAPAQAEGSSARRLRFSGYPWTVVGSPVAQGPGPNIFDSRNAYLDSRGHLVLELVQRDRVWSSAQLFLDRSLGYGDYELVLAPVPGAMDSRAVLGFYTWDVNPAYANREIDIEISRWGQASGPNLFFTVQPGEGHRGRQASFELDLSQGAILAFAWRKDSIHFLVRSGGQVHDWVFPSPATPRSAPFLVPPRGRERLGLNLWLMGGKSGEGLGLRMEIESFSFQKAR